MNSENQKLKISLIIAWVNPLDLLLPCLSEFKKQSSEGSEEIIVVTRHDEKSQQELRTSFPDITLLAAPPGTSIPKLRAMGLKQASGEYLVITEDHCMPFEDWLAVLREQINQGENRIIGGPVENGLTMRKRDQAAFLTEYAFAILPASSTGKSQPLAGNNIAYPASVRERLVETLENGCWESFIYPELEKDGYPFIFEPWMILFHHRPFNFWYFSKQRWVFSRSYAGMRNQKLKISGRLKYGLGSLILPPLLYLRGLMTLRKKGRYFFSYLLLSPLIFSYFIFGALGEMFGYFFGPRKSLAAVE
jgi:hypothetical protein